MLLSLWFSITVPARGEGRGVSMMSQHCWQCYSYEAKRKGPMLLLRGMEGGGYPMEGGIQWRGGKGP